MKIHCQICQKEIIAHGSHKKYCFECGLWKTRSIARLRRKLKS